MVIIGRLIAVVKTLSIACHYKNSAGNCKLEVKFKGEKAMTGLIMMVTGLMAGNGAWRGKHVELRCLVTD